MEGFLRLVKPLTASGRAKNAWSVCNDCMRYRPRRKSYWKKRQGEWVSTEVWGDAWEGKVSGWNANYSLQCPGYWSEERMVALGIPVAHNS